MPPFFCAQGRMRKFSALQHAARATSRGRISPTRFLEICGKSKSLRLYKSFFIGQTDIEAVFDECSKKEGIAVMRRNNRRSNAKKERIIMMASSAFVLTALTMTGIYMKSNRMDSEDDGYTIDFTALENSAENKLKEIAQNAQTENETDLLNGDIPNFYGMEDDLDYMPMETNSGLIEIPGLTDGDELQGYAPMLDDVIPDIAAAPETKSESDKKENTAQPEPKKQEVTAQPVVVMPDLNFEDGDELLRPMSGDMVALLPYSMDGGIYFSTLEHFKYNPALILQADVGTTVTACADGKVIDIFENEEIGHAVTMDLGNGYHITYGQLNGINVALNSFVNIGDVIGAVAEPTKYYIREGSNLYLMLTLNDEPIDPEPLLR